MLHGSTWCLSWCLSWYLSIAHLGVAVVKAAAVIVVLPCRDHVHGLRLVRVRVRVRVRVGVRVTVRVRVRVRVRVIG